MKKNNKKYIKKNNKLNFKKNKKIIKKKIIINKNLNIKELSEKINIKIRDIEKVIKSLDINPVKIKPEQTELILDYLNIPAEINNNENEIKEENIIKNDIIISVVGDVDNGKTTLINKICKKEFKNEEKIITQNININFINYKNNKIVFLDTPGHENLENFKNFSIKISNIILIIINIYEEISKNLLNLIKTLESKNILIIININKIDLFNYDEINKKENNLEILKNKYKLKFNISKTSSKDNNSINNLMEMILKVKENIKIENRSEKYFEGFIIDNNINKKEEIITTIFIKSGNLKKNEIILSKNSFCKIKKIYDYNNKEILNSNNNDIIKIKGFKENPDINNYLYKIYNKDVADKINKFKIYKNRIINDKENDEIKKNNFNSSESEEKKKLNIIIKSNSERIIESIKNILFKINTKNFKINIIKINVGNLNISDIKLSKITKSIIIAFNIEIKNNIKNLCKLYGISIFSCKVIYDIIKYIRELDLIKMYKNLKENISSIAKINKIFNIDNKLIAGCTIIYGTADLKSKIKIFRNKKEIYNGEIESLKLSKINVNEVKKNSECGIFIKNFKKYEINDIIKFYK